jgi:hypothetical protein
VRPPVVPVSALGLLTIVAYGACYYAYGVLIQPISADTQWPVAALGAIFSAIPVVTGVLGMIAGRRRCGVRARDQEVAARRGASRSTRWLSSASAASKLAGSPAGTGSGTDQCTAA